MALEHLHAKPKTPAQAAPAKRGQKPNKFEILKDRLPDGAEFHARWDAGEKSWFGSLTLQDGTRFNGRTSSVVKLCFVLDESYRQHLAEKPPVA